MQILDGKKTSEDIKNEIAAVVQKMKADAQKKIKDDMFLILLF